MSLRLRLAVVFSLATALAITMAGMLFLHQLRDNLDDTLDTGLRARLSENIADPPTGAKLDPFGPREQFTLVQNLDGTVVAATPAATQLRLTPQQRAQALAGEVVFTTDVAGARTRILVSTAPPGPRRVLVAVGTPTDIADDAIDRVQAALIAMGPIAVLAAGAAAWLLAGAALRPVEQMRREAAAISEHDPDRRLPVPTTRDEVAALATTMNDLLDRLHVALARDRQFMADAGHELRTPLAILRAELELGARPGRSQQALHAAIVEAAHETDRLIRLAEDLLLLARTDNRQPILRLRPTQLPELLATAIRRGRSRDREPPVEIVCPDDLHVTLDPDRMLQAIDNLLDNAIGHSPPGTPVHINVTREDTGTVVIEVIDSGPGLPTEFLPHAFERFRRAEHARSRDTGGTGLGLSIVQAIIEAHGGTVAITNRAPVGAQTTIRLQARPPAS
jgi:two-component system OmpR family sensor kinase